MMKLRPSITGKVVTGLGVDITSSVETSSPSVETSSTSVETSSTSVE
eukprot:CAMPEP_0114015830 /NCGR_PEP_ID=MMETSP0372-20130328/12980_1 /TAXON_ID=340204 /ORGANISM="Lankesteria abbotti" /LENGTH=46 /assembly_acc=CAM_ASM_000359